MMKNKKKKKKKKKSKRKYIHTKTVNKESN